MSSPSPADPSRRLLLLVDGDATALAAMAKLLADNGHVCLGATDAEMALGLARASRPQLVITEARLPDHGGLWLVELLRQHSPASKVLILSKGLSAAEAEEYEARGATSCLLKPLEPRLLLASVEGALVQDALEPHALPGHAEPSADRLAILRALLSGRPRQIQKPALPIRRKPFLPN